VYVERNYCIPKCCW